jgi:hypothetical protein
LAAHLEEEGDPGRVDELALLEPDDDRGVVAGDPPQHRLQALDAPEVELAVELQLAPIRPDRALRDLQDLPPGHALHCLRPPFSADFEN